MGHLYKVRGSSRWHFKYRVNGREIRQTSGTTDKREAQRLLALREGAAAAGKPLDLVATIGTVGAVVPHARYAFFAAGMLRDLKGPLVYVFLASGVVRYVGMSAGGLGRALAPWHHVLSKAVVGEADALMYFPVESAAVAETLEAQLIELLHPAWNNGHAPRPEVDMDALHRSMGRLDGLTSHTSQPPVDLEPGARVEALPRVRERATPGPPSAGGAMTPAGEALEHHHLCPGCRQAWECAVMICRGLRLRWCWPCRREGRER